MKKTQTAVIIGRFQSPYLHDGHVKLIKYAKDNYERVIILIGISPSINKENPLNFKMRKHNIMSCFDKVFIEKISDEKHDKDWVNKAVSIPCNRFKIGISDIVFVGGRDSSIPLLEESGYNVDYVDFDINHVSATKIRKSITYNDSTKSKSAFKAGVCYALNQQYDRINPTVDIAIINKKNRTLVFGKRKSEQGVRFVGGFVDSSDQSFEEAAVRELKEEAGIEIPLEELKYLGSFKSTDWRYKGSNTIVTSLFYIIVETSGVAGDDIDELIEIPFDSISRIPIEVEHEKLLECLKSHLTEKDILNKI